LGVTLIKRKIETTRLVEITERTRVEEVKGLCPELLSDI